ncbi:MAG TPA: LamG domain-containing protein [Candidatus Baltobacteraceae bacterium]|nr:LamG domain-containing protein [Candidatus Baltobacteraceae bacterium]
MSLALAACSGGGGSTPAPFLPDAGSSAPVTTQSVTTSSYPSVIGADAPTAYYHLDDTSTTANDASGNGLNGTIGSAVSKSQSSLVSSYSDTSVSLPGVKSTSDTVTFAASSKLQPSNAVSMEMLLRFTSTPANDAVPLAYGNDNSYAPYEFYFIGGQLVAQFHLSTGVVRVNTPSALAANTTYHAVATFNGTTAVLYINGKQVASSAKTGTLTNYVAGYGLTIGDDAAFSDPAFTGKVDEVAIYAGKALSATQVANHYAATTGSATVQPTSAPTAAPTTAPAPTSKPTANPTAAPTSAPTAAPIVSTGNVAMYQGCPVFTAGDYYNAPISASALDPNSANYINSTVAAGDTGTFYASTGYEKVNVATNSTPMLTVSQKVSYHTFPVQYPWQSGFYIEPLSDAHAMIVQTGTCHLYESYNTSFSGSTLSAYSGANWDMTKGFVPMTAGSPSAMASGLSIFAGMVKWEDYQSGAIRHALNFAAPAGSVAQWKFVRPASDTDGLAFKGTSSYQLPYGAHLRLKASFSTAGWGPEATMVANALKTYGMYLADTGSSSNALYFANSSSGTNPWSSSDLSSLGKLHISDFDVVTLPTVQTVPGH